MAHRDLGHFYMSTGDFSGSLKHFTKSRESCTTSQHVLDMCFSVLEVRVTPFQYSCRLISTQLLILQRNYSHIPTYVFKADAALDAASTPSAPAGSSAQPPAPASKKSPERAKWQSKLDLASAISQLGQGHYDKAANLFLKIGNMKDLGDWVGKVAVLYHSL